jgi:hypothetical protein
VNEVMTRLRSSTVATLAALLPVLLLAAPTDNQQQQRNKPAPSMELLQRAPLIRATVVKWPDGTEREFTFTDPAQLARVRTWIRDYAWPPIDLNTTGNVMQRGHFSVFERPTDKKPALTIHVFGVTTRAEPHITHVTNENWQKFLALLPPK